MKRELSGLVLDPSNPLDGDVIQYKRMLLGDKAPTAARQQRLAAGVRRGDPSITQEFVWANTGLVAVIAHAYRRRRGSEPALLRWGGAALLDAARTWQRNGADEFEDHMITAVDSKLALETKDRAMFGSETPGRPMEQVLRYVTSLKSPGEAMPRPLEAPLHDARAA